MWSINHEITGFSRDLVHSELHYILCSLNVVNIDDKLDQVYCAWLKKGLLCLYILYWVSKGLVCLYILEKVEIWSGDTDAWQTSKDRATQLLSSIKHKLSHAIITMKQMLWLLCVDDNLPFPAVQRTHPSGRTQYPTTDTLSAFSSAISQYLRYQSYHQTFKVKIPCWPFL